MATGHYVHRFLPQFDARWIIGLGVVVAAVVGLRTLEWGRVAPPLDLLALAPAGEFSDSIDIPAAWADTSHADQDVGARFPLILAVRNGGDENVSPGRLDLTLPLQYRLASSDGRELTGGTEAGSPLITYRIDPRVGAVEPHRLPAMIPDTLWLEVLLPRYYCVAVTDSVPAFVPAPPPPMDALTNVMIFYSFTGGSLRTRRTGLLRLRLDSAALHPPRAPEPPSYPVETGPAAHPALGALMYVGSRRARCGAPGDAMTLLSSVWETENGGRFYTLDYGGRVRKRLFDLDGDGVIERESWDPNGDGRFDTTRRTRLPVPDFLVPLPSRTPAADTVGADTVGADTVPPDTLPSGPIGRPAAAPDTAPPARDTTAPRPDTAPPARDRIPPARRPVPGGAPDTSPPVRDTTPARRDTAAPADTTAPAPPVGRPVRPVPPDTGGGGGT